VRTGGGAAKPSWATAFGCSEAEFGGTTRAFLDPGNLGAFESTEYLSLYHTKLSALENSETVRRGRAGGCRGTLMLCSQLAKFPKLEELNIGRNALTELPGTLGGIKTLKRLWFDDNGVTSLPLVSVCARAGGGRLVTGMCRSWLACHF